LGGARNGALEVPGGSPGKEWANMKEFDKKGNPSREPASEGMKGLSKFLPMTDSNYPAGASPSMRSRSRTSRRTCARSKPRPAGCAKKLEDAPKEFMILENKLREANRQLVQAFNQTRSSSTRSTRRGSRSPR